MSLTTMIMLCIVATILSDLKATVLSDKDVTVEKLESSKINLFTQHGNCKLKSLKVKKSKLKAEIIPHSTQ